MNLEVRHVGLIDYGLCLTLQRQLQQEIIAGTRGDVLLIGSHYPVITRGTSSNPEDFFLGDDSAEKNLPVFDIERGGSVTYHGPEQIVMYPLLNLNNLRRDVGWYMRSLEEVLLQTLVSLDIAACRIPKCTGVWMADEKVSRKIAFIGVRLSRWCSLHGLALNVDACAHRFSCMNPCGLKNIKITSVLEETTCPVDKGRLENDLISRFRLLFGYDSASTGELTQGI